MHGVGRLLSKLIAAIAILGTSMQSQAVEFANIVGDPETVAASRQASAEVLSGIINLIESIRLRELQESEGAEALKLASANLRSAADHMDTIIDKMGDEIKLSSVHIEVLQLLANDYFLSRNIIYPRDLKSLYEIFRNATREFADYLDKLQDMPLNDPIYPKIATALTQYLRLGNAVTRVAVSK
jgi:hypothetical protein